MAAVIRLATEEDAEQVAAIYAPFVTDTAVSFEVDAPDAQETKRRISATMALYPWLVCERGGELLGYAYTSQHRTRTAYQWSVDVAIYTGAANRRMGLGRALYTALLEVLPLQGFYNAYAGIALPNEASVGLHEAMGFEPIGVYLKVGFKLGRWHDVGWWQRPLQPRSAPTAAPLPFAAVSGLEAFQMCLMRGTRYCGYDANRLF